MPEKKLRVGIVGLPLLGREHKEWFEPGATHRLRSSVKAHLEEFSPELRKSKLSLVVEDCGEITRGREEMDAAVRKDTFAGISKEVKGLDRKYDLLIVVGGRHTGGYPLYQFPGKVVRVDFHPDTRALDTLNYASYLYHVLHDGLKTPKEIDNYGMEFEPVAYEDETPGSNRIKPPKGEPYNLYYEKTFWTRRRDIENARAPTFDIDGDGLHEKYKTTADSWYKSKNGVDAHRLGQAMIASGPRRVGFFEYYEQHPDAKSYERMIKALSKAALMGVAKRLLRR